tara:strand:+ start:314 stop:496 length:183 start_codon:yes stop_codon:yes gene_type:complete
MSCNLDFAAGIGCGVVSVLIVLAFCRFFRNGAVPVQPFLCPNCNYREVVVETLPVATVAL